MMFVARPPEWSSPDPALQKEWDDLRKRAGIARDDLTKAFEDRKKIEVNDSIYKDFMKFLKALFKGNCAYCQTKLTTGQPGDVEHFRPKGRVVDRQFKPIRVTYPDRGEVNHPGYFWLAYDWANLLPSCADCNRYRKQGPTGQLSAGRPEEGAGKADQFPLKDEASRAVDWRNPHSEHPLLIDPTDPNSDPTLHLQFETNGQVTPLTEEGAETLRVFGLNLREDLIKARGNAFDDAINCLHAYFDAVTNENAEKTRKNARRINDILRGEEPYSAMGTMALFGQVERYAKKNIFISLPLRE